MLCLNSMNFGLCYRIFLIPFIGLFFGMIGWTNDLPNSSSGREAFDPPIEMIRYKDGDLDLWLKVRGTSRDRNRELLDFKMHYTPGIRSKARLSRAGIILGGAPIELTAEQVRLENSLARNGAPGGFGIQLKHPAGDLVHIEFQEFGRVRFAFKDSAEPKLRDKVQSALIWEDMDYAKITRLNVPGTDFAETPGANGYRPVIELPLFSPQEDISRPTVGLRGGLKDYFSFDLQWVEDKNGDIQITSFKGKTLKPKKELRPFILDPLMNRMDEISKVVGVKRINSNHIRLDVEVHGTISPIDIFTDDAGEVILHWQDRASRAVSVRKAGSSTFIRPSAFLAQQRPQVVKSPQLLKIENALAQLSARSRSVLRSTLLGKAPGNITEASSLAGKKTFQELEVQAKAIYGNRANSDEWLSLRRLLWRYKTEFTAEETRFLLSALENEAPPVSLLGRCSSFFSRLSGRKSTP